MSSPTAAIFFGSHQQRLLAARAHHVRKRQATGRAPRWFDTESLAEVDCKQLYVGIERVEKIVRFEYRRYGLATRGEPIKVPNDFKTFTYNKSLECLTGCCYLPWCGSSARE